MIDKEKLLARRKKNKEQNDDKTLKRVYCLYRVSNKNQVDDDDIPIWWKMVFLSVEPFRLVTSGSTPAISIRKAA